MEAICYWGGPDCGDPETRHLAERSVALWGRLRGPNAPELVARLIRLAGVVGSGPEYEEADRYLARAMTIVEARYAGDASIEAAEALDRFVAGVLMSRKLSRDPSVRQLADRALTIRERRLGTKAPDLIRPLMNLARFVLCPSQKSAEERFAKLAQARRLVERAEAIAEASFATNAARLADELDGLVDFYQTFGPVVDAYRLRERVFHLRERSLGSESRDVAWLAHQRARSLFFLGEVERAWPHMERAFSIYKRQGIKDGKEYAASLNLKGLLLGARGDYSSAKQALEEGLHLRERLVLSRPSSDVGQSLNNLGNLHSRLGDYRSAVDYFRRTIDNYTVYRSSTDTELATPLTNMGVALMELGDFPQAGRRFQDALDVIDRREPDVHPYYAPTFEALGDLHIRSGDPVEGRRCLEEALARYEWLYGPSSPDLARVLVLLSKADAMKGNRSAALEKARRALDIQERLLGDHHPEVARTLGVLMGLYTDEGRAAEAFEAALRASRIAREHLRFTARALPERLALKYALESRKRTEGLLALAAHAPNEAPWDEVFDEEVRSRAVVLDEMALRRRNVVFSADPALARIAGALDQQRSRCAALLLDSEWPARPHYLANVKSCIEESENLERKLASRSLLASKETSRAGAGIDDVRQNLPPDSALVSYVRYDSEEDGTAGSQYGTFVLRSGQAHPRFAPLGAGRAIEARVVAWRDLVARRPASQPDMAKKAEASLRDAARALRRAIWDPVAGLVAGASRVLIVPDGELNLVNFATLPLDEGNYLLETGPTFHYLSSERDLLGERPARRTPGDILLLGGAAYDSLPVLSLREGLTRGGFARRAATALARAPSAMNRGATSSCEDFRSLRFEPLLLSETEVRDLASLWKSNPRGKGSDTVVRVLIGTEASETAFKVEAPRYRILHIATHGFFLDPDCFMPDTSLRSASTGGGGAPWNLSSERGYLLRENPLLRSGLALAGANLRGRAGNATGRDDGILTAEEIASLDLSGVDWAVLSACETGLGQIQAGEGVLGLQRAFRVAGAATLIMSLWEVSDDESRFWMQELYRCRLAGKPTDECVRTASRQRLDALSRQKGQAHPYYWGAFIAAGDWR